MTQHKFFNRRRTVAVLAVGAIIAAGTVFCLKHSKQQPTAILPTAILPIDPSFDQIEYTHDGKLLMCVDALNHVVEFRDANTGTVLRSWIGGTYESRLSQDSTRFIEADAVTGVTHCVLRDARTGKVLRKWTGQLDCLTPDFKLMVTSADRKVIAKHTFGPAPEFSYVVVPATGRVVGRFKTGDAWRENISPDCKFLCLPHANGASQLLALPSMSPVLELPSLICLRVSRDDTRAFGLTDNSTLCVWDLRTKMETSFPTGLSRAYGLRELTDGTIAFTGEQSGASGQRICQVRTADGAQVLRVVPDFGTAYEFKSNNLLVSEGHPPLTTKIIDLQTGKYVAVLDLSKDAIGQPLSHFEYDGVTVCATPTGDKFAALPGCGFVELFNRGTHSVDYPSASTDTGTPVLSFGDRVDYPTIWDALTLPGGGVAAAGQLPGSGDQPVGTQIGAGQLSIYRPGQIVVGTNTAAGDGFVSRIGLTPDGHSLTGISAAGIWTISLLDGHVSGGGPVLYPFDYGRNAITPTSERPVWPEGTNSHFSVIFNGDFKTPGATKVVWDSKPATYLPKRIFPPSMLVDGKAREVSDAAVSPDGKILAVSWRPVTQQTGPKHEPIISPPDVLDLRDARTGQIIRRLLPAPHLPMIPIEPELGGPLFSHDGGLLALTDGTGWVYVFDARNGILTHKVFVGHGDQPNDANFQVFDQNGTGLAFSPDGRFMAVSRPNGSIYLVSLTTDLPVAQMGQITDRESNGDPNAPLKTLSWMDFDASGRTLYGIEHNGSDVLAFKVPKLN